MAKKQLVKVGKHQVELSNLDKVLFPEQSLTKAEIIHYYLQVAPAMLRHLKGRPLSLIRFPDGIHGERFYQKNKPDWTPDWMEYISLGKEEKKDYLMANDDAALVWLANLACLEMHQMQVRSPDFILPDYFVFDLDPPEGFPFKQLIPIAFDVKDYLEDLGYPCFVKTSGGKGLHLLVPLEMKYSYDELAEFLQELSRPLVELYPRTLTLNIKKEARQGKVLLDIYRNRRSQTIVSAYSLRGRPEAPVSAPISWENLENLERPEDLNMHSVPVLLQEHGDPWQSIKAHSVGLHTDPKVQIEIKVVPETGKHKNPAQLEKYRKKRDFRKTREPGGNEPSDGTNRFVVHRHHARRLHYDLRLEEGGVLKSWAVPKGLPPYPGIKRLAMETEDHPVEYLGFEGTIPQGEYGGGNMWIYASGKFEYVKKKKDGFYFRLYSSQVAGEFRIHRTREKEWLLERVDQPQPDWFSKPVSPMLAELGDHIPTGTDFGFEVKWDGIRAIFVLQEGTLKIFSRNLNEITGKFPEFQKPDVFFRATNGIFDGEIVVLDQDGKPDFTSVLGRLHKKSDPQPGQVPPSQAAVCYLFDCIYLDGRLVANETLSRRKEWLQDAVKKNSVIRISEMVDDGVALFEAVKRMKLEGIIAKKISCPYLPGKRTADWLKIKVSGSGVFRIVGYTEGVGERSEYFGALHLAVESNNKLIYRGKVGTGFNEKSLRSLSSKLKNIKPSKKPFQNKIPDEKKTVWISPELQCEVKFSELTSNGILRAPVFIDLTHTGSK